MSGKNMQRKNLQRSKMEQGDIVLIDFSYSDLKRSKFRPALVISNSRYNSTSLDVVVLRITSKPRREWAIKITNKDIESGFLEVESFVKVDSIFTIERKMVAKVVARLKEEKVDEVKMKLAELFEVR
ncbi:MAG: PemK-like, MazF-like toxin of type II toxin-antitoxin system [Candidatus Argoarchaeum ethanivorans]|uniref:PemK-like, MazF-like toxin of type II toxin-antitoxin system n=1 Tax=Candidatus Argoarchaeum ethanivorans TaxID=2608793 RepID=A0A811TH70_9EURY|nr:MAG: PemK-like, MazF-like toxin of type II toxin-antitoxin system [Candidatus Argoarchaeum ethanivorans]